MDSHCAGIARGRGREGFGLIPSLTELGHKEIIVLADVNKYRISFFQHPLRFDQSATS